MIFQSAVIDALLQVDRRQKNWDLLCWKFESGEDADPPDTWCGRLCVFVFKFYCNSFTIAAVAAIWPIQNGEIRLMTSFLCVANSTQ